MKSLAVLSVVAVVAAGGAVVDRWLSPANEASTVSALAANAAHQAQATTESLRLGQAETSPPGTTSLAPTEGIAGASGHGSDFASQDPATLSPADAMQLLQRAEQHILDGSYRTALERLRRLRAAAPDVQPGRVAYWQGFCSESLGELDAARLHYEQSTAAMGTATLTRAARLAHARVLQLSGRTELVAAALYREVLQLGAGEWEALDADAAHLLAAALAEPADSEPDLRDPFDDATLFAIRVRLDPQRSLTPLQLEVGVAADVADLPWGVQRVADATETAQPGLLSIRADSLPIRELVDQIARIEGLTVRTEGGAPLHGMERSVSANVIGIPVGIAFDALLAPLGLTWSVTAGELVVADAAAPSPPNSGDEPRARQKRALEFALSRAPEHPWAGVSAVSLARLAAESADRESALILYRRARQLSRGRSFSEAHINEGKLALQLNDRELALESFYRCVDSSDAHPLKMVAYAYLGRLQIEADTPHAAIASLQRAVALAEGTPHESLMVSLLSAALLLDGNPEGANTTLNKRRDTLFHPELDAAAAFLGALARYRAAASDELRKREAANLIESLTRLQPAKLFGGHWQPLAVEAYQAVGLTAEAERTFRECLVATRPYPLRRNMVEVQFRMQLAGTATSELTSIAEGLLRDADGELGLPARLSVAEAEFRRGLDAAALPRAQAVAADPAASLDVRAAALRLLGRVHQHRGEHAEAIRCFSGLLPGADLPSVDLHELQTSPSSGGGT